MPRAQRDLVDIFGQIGAETSDTARVWYLGLRDCIRSLYETPGRCPTTPEDAELRHLLYGRKPRIYRVIFRIVEKQKLVEVLHIRHGARPRFKASDVS